MTMCESNREREVLFIAGVIRYTIVTSIVTV